MFPSFIKGGEKKGFGSKKILVVFPGFIKGDKDREKKGNECVFDVKSILPIWKGM